MNISDSIKFAMSLILISCVIVFLFIIRKRMKKQLYNADAGSVRIVSTVNIGLKERITVIDVSNYHLVLGITPGRITLLTSINKTMPSDHLDQVK
jgi:flagellar biogenesis protein FliO